MTKQFDEAGLRFSYPEDWKLETEGTDDFLSVTLDGPGTAFVLINQDKTSPEPEEMLASSLEALRVEYQDIEVEDRLDSVAGIPAFGHDIHFTVLDLTNTCCVRSFADDEATYMVLWQATDTDMGDVQEAFEQIYRSIELTGE